MSNEPIDLDKHRSPVDQIEAEGRRFETQTVTTDRDGIDAFLAEHGDLRRRQEAMESELLAAPLATWPEVAEISRYLIWLYAATPDAGDPRRRALIAHVLDALDRLLDNTEERS